MTSSIFSSSRAKRQERQSQTDRPRQVIELIEGCERYGVAAVLRQISEGLPKTMFMALAPGAMTDELPPSRILWIGARGRNVLVEKSTFLGLVGVARNLPAWWKIAGQAAQALSENPVLFHCHNQYTTLIAALIRLRRPGSDIKILFHFHGTMNQRRGFGLLSAAQRLIMGFAADGIVAVSKAVGDYWKPIGCPLWVVHNGIAPAPPAAAPARLEAPRDVRHILIAGSLSRDKGHLVAVEAMKLLGPKAAGFHLWIAGGPDDEKVNPFARELRKTISEAHLDSRVTLLGFIPDVRERLPAAWVALQQRLSAEPCSMWVLETLQAGVPLIASRTGGTPELVRHDREGLLVAPGDPKAVAEAILRLDEDPELRQRLAENAAARAKEFSIERFIAKIGGVHGFFGTQTNGQPPRTILMLAYNTLPTMLSGRSLISLVRRLDPARYRAAVVFNRPCDAEQELSRLGVPTAIITYGGGNWLKRAWQYGRLPFALRRFAEKLGPSLIYADSVMAGRAAGALKRFTGLPTVVHIRNIGLPPRTAAFVLQADRFTAVSRAALQGTLPPEHASKGTVVLDGLELSDYLADGPALKAACRRDLGLPPDALVVAMAGRLSAQKGQKYFVEAAQKVLGRRKNVLFVHAGGVPSRESADPYERELAASSADLCAAGTLRWLEYMDRIEPLWAAADVAVVPSCGPEALGRVVLEAMAMGRPVVAARSGGPEEIIDPPKNGLLVAMADSDALAGAVSSLLDDSLERERLGRSGRERVERLFSAENYARGVMGVFDQMSAPQKDTRHE